VLDFVKGLNPLFVLVPVFLAFVVALYLRKAAFKECLWCVGLLCGGIIVGSSVGYVLIRASAKTSALSEPVTIKTLLVWYLATFTFAKLFFFFRFAPKLFQKIKKFIAKTLEQATN